jgi:hypothetical protein
MNIKRITPYLLVLAALVLGYLMISPTAQAASPSSDDSKEISKLFDEAKFEAHQLEQDAAEIETFNKTGLGWQSHADKLGAIRHHINKSGKLLAQLHQLRNEGSAWQQKAIGEIEPLLKELADNTQAAVEHFSDNKEIVHMSATYQEYLKSNSVLSKELSALITDYVGYGFHKAEFERLGEKVVASER